MGVANSDRLPSLMQSTGDVGESWTGGIIEPIGGVGIDPSDGARIELWLVETASASDEPSEMALRDRSLVAKDMSDRLDTWLADSTDPSELNEAAEGGGAVGSAAAM